MILQNNPILNKISEWKNRHPLIHLGALVSSLAVFIIGLVMLFMGQFVVALAMVFVSFYTAHTSLLELHPEEDDTDDLTIKAGLND